MAKLVRTIAVYAAIIVVLALVSAVQILGGLATLAWVIAGGA